MVPGISRASHWTCWRMLLPLRDGWFTLPAVRAGLLYIFGGGHVSQALVPVAATVGFRPFIYDDRPEFAAKARFPQAAGTLCGSFTALSRHLTITPNDYVVIMTRGHQADFEVLVQTLRCGARYLGCIGSRKKLALCRDRLLANGFTPEEYARSTLPSALPLAPRRRRKSLFLSQRSLLPSAQA